MKLIKASIIALVLAASLIPFILWAQQSEAELLKQARVTKHQAKKIALARVKGGTISVDVETPISQRKEAAEDKVKK